MCNNPFYGHVSDGYGGMYGSQLCDRTSLFSPNIGGMDALAQLSQQRINSLAMLAQRGNPYEPAEPLVITTTEDAHRAAKREAGGDPVAYAKAYHKHCKAHSLAMYSPNFAQQYERAL